jgi:hypothetical protein
MADTTKNDAPTPAPQPESPKTTTGETKDYVLKTGAQHTFIKEGQLNTVTGDGRQTIPLTDEQARLFQDKLAPDQELPEGSPITFAVGEETGGRPTMEEGGAAASQAMGLDSPAPKDESAAAVADETGKTVGDTGVAQTSGQGAAPQGTTGQGKTGGK